jgi:hypothetical protein
MFNRHPLLVSLNLIFYFYITIMCSVSMDQVFKVYDLYAHQIPFCNTYTNGFWVKPHSKNILPILYISFFITSLKIILVKVNK